MTYGDLLDQIVKDSGDESGSYRVAARRWLNLARSEIGNEALWKSALRPECTITTVAATDIYSLADSSVSATGFEFLVGDELYDQTNANVIRHESLGETFAADPEQTVTGPPVVWADAGATAAGVRQIRLWPVPDGVYTLQWSGYILMSDVADSDDGDTVDDFFGPLLPWAATFVAGMRYYHDLNNNEDAQQVILQEQRFRRMVVKKRAQNRLSLSSSLQFKVISTQNVATLGRFDPAHYSNR